jgi:hypothetical protein
MCDVHYYFYTTPLLKAIISNDIEKCKILVKTTECLNCGLIRACVYGYLDIALLLIENGATIIDNSITYAKNIETIKFLINNGANNWDHIMIWGCKHGCKDVIDIAISHGAHDFNQGLLFACWNDNVHLAELMIKHGAYNLNVALQYTRTEQIKLCLLKNGVTRVDYCIEIGTIKTCIPYTYKCDCFNVLVNKRRYDIAAIFYIHDKRKIRKAHISHLLNNGADIPHHKIHKKRYKLQSFVRSHLITNKIKIYDRNIINMICNYIPFK